jgi:Trypsin-co-occurring domain 1
VVSEDPVGNGAALVPMIVNDHRVYLSVQEIRDPQRGRDEEVEIASRRPTLDQVLGGLTGFAKEMATRLQGTDASKVSVEFGCEFALESGTFVAVIGKATAKSTFKVALEWTKPAP